MQTKATFPTEQSKKSSKPWPESYPTTQPSQLQQYPSGDRETEGGPGERAGERAGQRGLFLSSQRRDINASSRKQRRASPGTGQVVERPFFFHHNMASPERFNTLANCKILVFFIAASLDWCFIVTLWGLVFTVRLSKDWGWNWEQTTEFVKIHW